MKRWLFLIPIFVLALVVPNVSLAAVNSNFVLWSDTAKQVELTDDVRTVTFSHPVSESSLQTTDGKQLISLWDVTNPENKQQLHVELTLNQADETKVHVKLAEGYAYKPGHTYSLFIEKDVASQESVSLKNGIQFNFEMFSKSPIPVNFGKSIKVTNTLNEAKSVKVSKGAFYVSYDEYGYISTNIGVDSTYDSITLGGKETAIVTYLPGVTAEIKEQDGLIIEPTSETAFNGMKLYEGNSVQVTNIDAYNMYSIFAGNRSATTYYSSAFFNEDGTNSNYEYNVETTGFGVPYFLNKQGHAVITNEGKEPMYVYSPNTTWKYSSIKAVDEEAVTVFTLQPNHNAKITSNEDDNASTISLRELTKKGSFTYVAYNEKQEAYLQELDHSIYPYFGDDTIQVFPKGDTILKNSGEVSQVLYGPARHISIEATNENPLILYTLQANEKVNIKTTEDKGEFGSSVIYLRDLSKKGLYSLITYDNQKLDSIKELNHSMYKYGDDTIRVYKTGDTVLKNSGNTVQTLYGASRYITFEATDEEPIIIYTLEPGKTVKLETSEIKEVHGSTIYLRDLSKKGLFSYVYYRNNEEYSKRLNNGIYTYGDDTIHIYLDGYSLLKNSGNTNLTLYGSSRFITIEELEEGL